MSFVLNQTDWAKKLPTKARAEVLKWRLPSLNFFGDDKSKTTFDVKTAKENVDFLATKYKVKPSIVRGAHSIVLTINGTVIRLISSGKSSSGRTGDAVTTAMQEKASMEAIRQAIVHSSSQTLDLSLIVSVYPSANNDWLKSFKAQYDVVKKSKVTLGWSSFTEFNRDGGFMTWISNLVKTKFGIIKKDTWNPADIWLINDIEKVKKNLDEAESLSELNARMVKLALSGTLVGVSLKLTKAIAKIEPVNLDNSLKFRMHPLTKGSLFLNLKSDDKSFQNDEFSFEQDHHDGIISVQVRAFPVKKTSGIQVSYKLKGGSAEFGKVPKAMMVDIFKTNNVSFPVAKELPTSAKEFEATLPMWKEMINHLLKVTKYNLNIKSFDEFYANCYKIYANNTASYHNSYMNQKFQCIQFAYSLSKMKDIDSAVTDFAYLAQKKGDQFGPFYKIS
jgi:hypothetical protein